MAGNKNCMKNLSTPEDLSEIIYCKYKQVVQLVYVHLNQSDKREPTIHKTQSNRSAQNKTKLNINTVVHVFDFK